MNDNEKREVGDMKCNPPSLTGPARAARYCRFSVHGLNISP